jgi:hypothetical protein
MLPAATPKEDLAAMKSKSNGKAEEEALPGATGH